jgi:hypothetical protein
LNWGNHWGQEKGMGRDWGSGGQITSNLGLGWTRIAPHRKEEFQVCKRDSVTKGVISFILSSCICVSCYCVNVANKRIVFRL